MPDEVDRGNEQAERILGAELAERERRAREARLIPCGRCHWCDASVRAGEKFCAPDPRFPDESCARDYDHAQAARLRNGG